MCLPLQIQHFKISKGKNQAILIGGESGAGKVEATKQCLAFLADGTGSEGILRKKYKLILYLKPTGMQKLCEITIVVDLASGSKYTSTMKAAQFVGKIDNLLEKSRLAYQQKDERNYHIFYRYVKSQGLCTHWELQQCIIT